MTGDLRQSRDPRSLLLPLCLFAALLLPATARSSQNKPFKLDLDETETESGERLQLHSQGSLAETVDLDTLPQVKRVACAGNRLLLAMTDDTVAHGWRVGQVVVGSRKWGCNATKGGSFGVGIYIKIAEIVFPVEKRPEVSPVDMVTIHHVTAGPFDMLHEANIFFHYEPGTTNRRLDQGQHSESRARFRRSLYNLVTNLVNNIDWHANFTSLLPFDIGLDSNKMTADKMAIHKSWGEKELTITRGQSEADNVNDDFILLLDRLNGESRLSYTFDLVIKNVKGSPQIVRYISQFDVRSDLSTDAMMIFNREMGLTYNVTVRESPTTELLRMPVAASVGLPPIYLVVTVQSLMQASVHAYSSGAAVLRTAYNGTGFVTLSQQFDPALSKASDATSRDWSVQAQEQTLNSSYRTEVTFSVYQTLKFQSAISWHYHDVDLELSPPSEITVRPQVTLRSSRPGVSRCVDSKLTLDSHLKASASQLTVQAFGWQIWDVPLQAAMSRDLQLLDVTLGQQCHARCHGPSQLINAMSRTSAGPVTRGNHIFSSLRAMGSDVVRFVDSGQGASWCGNTGEPCYNCSVHALDTPTDATCAARLMTARLVSAVTHLAEMVAAEWPDRQLLVVEAWDEPTSLKPTGVHAATSPYREGRAATVGLTARADPAPLALTPGDLDRLGQLAVCAGLEHVQERAGQAVVEVGVEEDGHHVTRAQLGAEEADTRSQFWDLLTNMDVTSLYPQCTASAPHMSTGSRWPEQTGCAEDVCGPTERPLDRANRQHMDTLVQYNLDDNSMTFEPEGTPNKWCGAHTRKCSDCVTSSASLEPWDWCSTGMMTPRAALRLRTLQKLAESAGFGIHVIQAFGESTQTGKGQSIFDEGRALTLTTTPQGNESSLASLAVCAGFDFVEYSAAGHVRVYVKTQDGYRAHTVEFLEGSTHLIVSPSRFEDDEYEIPTEDLAEESDVPLLVDGGFQPDVTLSEHVSLRDVMSRDSRYFRLDELLLTCLELVIDDFDGNLEIVKGSAYRTRSANFLHNLDTRHEEEWWRHMTGQALRLRPLPSADSSSLLQLATSILRECPSLARADLRAVGLGCHDDHIYLDLRPLEQGREYEFVKVWDSGTSYYRHVLLLQLSLFTGGPVVQSESAVTCQDRGLDPGLEFLSFQLGQQGLCQVRDQAEFCQISHSARETAADNLQEVLTAAAGHGRLPRFDIIHDIRACLVDNCGGCPGAGPIFDAKVRACSRVVHKYLERAAAPYPDLKNVTFFNTDTAESTVHGEACKTGRVCVEETVIYSLLVPTVTARFYPNPAKSLEREMFAAFVNPTPLLDIAAQELAFRAKGVVIVYIEAERDTYALRNVLKILFTYNKNVSLVEIHVAPGVDVDLVTSSIQRKVTTWAGVACPEHSRFAMTPFLIVQMDTRRHKRSAELSGARNRVKSSLYDWERDWLNKMF